MTLTDLLLDGLRLRLETPADPRDIILSDDNTVIQELQDMIRTSVQAEIGKLSDFMGPRFSTPGAMPTPEGPAEPVPDISHYSNTVLQEDEHAAECHTSAGQPGIQGKAALVARLHEMRASGLSLSQIAGQLQAEGLPTLSGKGQWQKGTIDKLLHRQAKSQGQPV
jgi:hypothetical protein